VTKLPFVGASSGVSRVLRITINDNSHRAIIKLEGRVSGPWVGELERSWRSLVTTKGNAHPLVIDLSDVTFISTEGKILLGEMYRQGAELRVGALMELTLEQIKQAAQGPETSGHGG